jgi:hypothetical protein
VIRAGRALQFTAIGTGIGTVLALGAVLGFAAVFGLGCAKNPADERVDGWALTRAALTNGRECFAGRREYCITDPDFVDAAIKPRLDDLYGGEMPMKRLKVDGTIRSVRREYRRALLKPENIARVEELVKERYDDPKITLKGEVVSADMGVVPGHLVAIPASLSLEMASSPLVQGGLWAESEARRVLGDLASRYPTAAVIRVVVTIVADGGLAPLVYRYVRAEKRVVVSADDGRAWASRTFEGDEGLATVSLRPSDLAGCAMGAARRVAMPETASAAELCPPDTFEAAR